MGSRTLSKRGGIEVSPATIRNVLADLEDEGYLMQPHTSAGRVPTAKAFRTFVDALMELQDLTHAEHALIRTRFGEMEPGSASLHETGKLLSELTGTAAIVVAPRRETQALQQLRFIRTRPQEVLAVLVMKDGTVQNRFIKVDVSDNELVRIHNLLDDVIEGRTLGDLRSLFGKKKNEERVREEPFRRTAFEMGEAAVREISQARAEVVVEGRDRLLDRPEFADPAGFKSVVNALDDDAVLLGLIDATLAVPGTSVLVGEEAGPLAGGQLAVVGAAYSSHGANQGAVGIIGPTRMDYPKIVPLVRATAHAMSMMLERTDQDDRPRGAESDVGIARGEDEDG